ncbi:hypothetical protein J6590_015910 [Homalodisca vitripennis]|nr:hypothetical protein J6590_015910 [Homalodisca vitripennis]
MAHALSSLLGRCLMNTGTDGLLSDTPEKIQELCAASGVEDNNVTAITQTDDTLWNVNVCSGYRLGFRDIAGHVASVGN